MSEGTASPVLQRRAMIYDWFSGLFAQELNDEQFAFYQSGQANAWLATLAKIGLAHEIQAVKKAIAQWKHFEAIDLCADFAELFLLDQKTAAIPYASFYLEDGGQLYGEMESRMRHFLSKNQLQMHANFKEPADHLAVYLALMQQWTQNAMQETEGSAKVMLAEQHDFLHSALLNWLPDFVDRCQVVKVENHFYPEIARLLLAFVRLDADYLYELTH